MHLADARQLRMSPRSPRTSQPRVQALADAFWPGPLTLLLPRAPLHSRFGHRRPPARRRPRSRASGCAALLRLAGVPIAAPSANTLWPHQPDDRPHVLADLDGRIDAVVDGGATAVGVESTVLDPAAHDRLPPGRRHADADCRPFAELARLFTCPPQHASQNQSLPSPGVGIRHYAPRAQAGLVDSLEDTAARSCGGREARARAASGVMLPDGWSC